MGRLVLLLCPGRIPAKTQLDSGNHFVVVSRWLSNGWKMTVASICVYCWKSPINLIYNFKSRNRIICALCIYAIRWFYYNANFTINYSRTNIHLLISLVSSIRLVSISSFWSWFWLASNRLLILTAVNEIKQWYESRNKNENPFCLYLEIMLMLKECLWRGQDFVIKRGNYMVAVFLLFVH